MYFLLRQNSEYDMCWWTMVFFWHEIYNLQFLLEEFRGSGWGKTAKVSQAGKFDPDAVCGTAEKPGCDKETSEENQRGTHDGKELCFFFHAGLFYPFFFSSKKYIFYYDMDCMYHELFNNLLLYFCANVIIIVIITLSAFAPSL